PGSPAALAGIPPEAILMKINEVAVQTPDDVIHAVNHAGVGAEINIEYSAFGELEFRKVRLVTMTRENEAQLIPPMVRSQSTNATRLEALERRIEVLERRIRQYDASRT